MRYRHIVLAITLLAGAPRPAAAFAPDGCEQQRKQYPEKWNDTSTEKKLFICESQQGRYIVKTGTTDAAQRTLMSLVPFSRSEKGEISESNENVLRIWLDREQTARLREGKYMATVVRKEDSCWIRGDLGEDVIFLMDNANPKADDPDKAGSFYNKAPRFSVIGGGSVTCERAR